MLPATAIHPNLGLWFLLAKGHMIQNIMRTKVKRQENYIKYLQIY